MFCVSSRPNEAGYEVHQKRASPEDRQNKLETNVPETDSGIQTSETQSNREIVQVRYPWEGKSNDKRGKSEKRSVTILITERDF
jgi:hypothetical protein